MKLRQTFTDFWNSLNTHLKSALISGSGLLVAIGALQLAKTLFPAADFTNAEYAVTVAISAFVVNVVKEQTLTN